MFVDEVKLLGRIRHLDDFPAFHSDLIVNTLSKTSWQIDFNVDKCHIMECGIGDPRPLINCV